MGTLVWFCLNLGEYQPFLYRGGFALVAITTAVLIAAVVYPRARLVTGLLAWAPLRTVGLRSYGIYLWHWPVFMLSRPQLDVPLDGLPLLLGRLVVTVVLADLSYRFVETPIRRGALGRTFGALREARGTRRWEIGARVAGTAVPVLVGCVALGLAVAHAQPPKPPSYLSTAAVHTETPTDKQATAQAPITSTAHKREDSSVETTTPKTAPGDPKDPPRDAAMPEKKADPAASAANNAAPATVGPVTAIGDSVMLGTVEALEKDIPNLQVIDAQEGLQVSDGIYILRQRRAAGQLGDVVIVHLGTNGTFTAEQFDEMMEVLSGVSRVILVNDKVPLQWEESNDQVIAEGVRRYPKQAILVDWRAASTNLPDLFWDDGIHLRPEGARFYAELIASRFEDR